MWLSKLRVFIKIFPFETWDVTVVGIEYMHVLRVHYECSIGNLSPLRDCLFRHHSDVIMSAIASQITGVSIVCKTVFFSGADQRKYQWSASLAFLMGIHRWPVNSPHKGPCSNVAMFPFDVVIMRTNRETTVVDKMFSPLWNVFIRITLLHEHLYTDCFTNVTTKPTMQNGIFVDFISRYPNIIKSITWL